MKLSNPHMLYLVWVVLLLAGVIVYGTRKRARILGRFASAKAFEAIAPGVKTKKRLIRGVLTILAFLCLVAALAGPLVGFRWETVEQKGVDIMICLDLSRSMLAQDIKPSRLERAKREILDLLGMMKSDRAGLVAFAGKAILQCPLTMDHGAFNIFLNALEPDYLPVGGTDIGGAIDTALSGFEKEQVSEKAIILITDGENTSGVPLEVAKKAARENVRIFCIGVGSEAGAPVPDVNGGFKKDGQGRIVISKVDDSGLEKIASTARGVYVRSDAGDMDLDLIYDREIRGRMEKKTLKSGKRKVWENRFQWFLFPAVVLLLIETMLADNRRGIFFSLLFAAVLLGSTPAPGFAGASKSVQKGIEAYQAGEYERAEKHFIDAQLDRPEMAELYYNIGSAAYKKGDYEAAVKNFTRAGETDDSNLKAKAGYNLGNALYRSGRIEDAIKEYEGVLSLAPGDTEAKENLEFVKKKLKERKKQQKENKNKDQQNDKQNKDQQDKGRQGQNKPGNNKPGDNKDGDSKDGNKDRQQNKPSDSNPKGSGKSENSKSGEQPGDPRDKQDNASQSPDDKPEKQDAGKEQARQQSPPENGQGAVDQQARARERMLNRLTDKPGRAMMPAYDKGRVAKDW
ncbi:MAG: VWA domain-containing protein [Desulfobacteraceae bacterium]|nr:VWA domain-containing protein [Desulfobacteraceae bacterium]